MARGKEAVCCLCKAKFAWEGERHIVCPTCGHRLSVCSGPYITHLKPECPKCQEIQRKIAECKHEGVVTSASNNGLGYSSQCQSCGVKGPAQLTIAGARRAFERKFRKRKIPMRK
jgi:hypothetical protein